MMIPRDCDFLKRNWQQNAIQLKGSFQRAEYSFTPDAIFGIW